MTPQPVAGVTGWCRTVLLRTRRRSLLCMGLRLISARARMERIQLGQSRKAKQHRDGKASRQPVRDVLCPCQIFCL